MRDNNSSKKTFNQEFHLTEKLFFTYAVQQPEVHHRTGSTSVLKQISLLLCSVPAAVGKYYNFLPSYHNLLIYRTTKKKTLRREFSYLGIVSQGKKTYFRIITNRRLKKNKKLIID